MSCSSHCFGKQALAEGGVGVLPSRGALPSSHGYLSIPAMECIIWVPAALKE